jgi:hypothetical protein
VVLGARPREDREQAVVERIREDRIERLKQDVGLTVS